MPFRKNFLATMVASSLAVSSVAHAADDVDADSASVLPNVVVTATRSERSALDVPASIDSIKVDPRDTLNVNPSDYLQNVPGVLARDRQNYAQDEQISIRGFGASSTFGVRGVRLYEDGIPITMPDGQGQTASFPLDSADRIEVLRGPFSALYGNASGGVIQIFTADGSGPPVLRTSLAGGSYGTWRAGANLSGSDGLFGYDVDLSHFYTDNYRGHGRAERDNGNTKLTFDLGDGRKLTLLGNFVALPQADDPMGLTRAQFNADPRMAQPVAVQFDTRKSVHQQMGGAVYDQPLGDDQSLKLTAYYGERDVQQFQAIPVSVQASPTSPGGVIGLDGNFGGADARWNWHGALAGQPLEVTAGLSYDRQDQHRTGYNNFIGSDLGVLGALRRDEQDEVWNLDEYFQASWNFSDRWSLDAGVRHSDVKFFVDDNYITAANPDDSGRRDYSATSPVAGLMFRATERWHLYANYGNGFETPTFNMLGYRPNGSAGINFDLVPARSRNGEIGSKLMLDNGSYFNLDVFQSDTHNELAVDTSSGGRTTYQNVDRARRRGVEAEYVWQIAPLWQAQFAYTWIDAQYLSAFLTCPAATSCSTPSVPVAAGSHIPGIPDTIFHAALRYGDTLGWNATIETNAAGKTPVNDLNTQFASGYGVVNLAGGYAFETSDAKISTFIRLDNLFGKIYAGSVIVNESNGRYFEPAAGRTIFGGVTVNWKL
jgi:iron complex outermembrane receptor protein